MVTHDPREALVSADTVSVMRDGRVDVTGDPADICVCTTDADGVTMIRLCGEAGGTDCHTAAAG